MTLLAAGGALSVAGGALVGLAGAAQISSPFGAASPWNVPIPAVPTLDPSSAAIIAKINGWGGPASLAANVYGTTSDFDVPVYQASPSDPLFTINATANDARSFQIQGTQIRIPNAATPAGGSDHHLVVIDPTGRWIYDFWNVTSKPAGGGTLTCSAAGRARVRGDGFDNANAVAAKTSARAGLVTAAELQAGVINHAIAIFTKSTNGANVWPASGNAGALDATNAPPNGAWLQLNMSDAEIEGLGVYPWLETVLKALAEYGGVVVDTGGASWNFRFLGDASTAALGGAEPVAAFADAQGDAGGWYLDSGSGIRYGDLKAWVDWSKLRVLDPTYMRGLYEARRVGKLDPDGTISNNWTVTGAATAQQALTEATYPPFAADSALRIGTNTVGRVCELSLPTPAGSPDAIIGWYWGNTAAGTTYKMSVMAGATELASYTQPANQNYGWRAVPVEDLTGVDLTDLRLRFELLSGSGFSNVLAAHGQAEYALA